MLKVSSIASHRSHSRLLPHPQSVLVGSTTTNMVAMDNGLVDPSERNQSAMTLSHDVKGSHPRDCSSSSGAVVEPPSKRIKVELPDHSVASSYSSGGAVAASAAQPATQGAFKSEVAAALNETQNGDAPPNSDHGGSSVITSSSGASHTSASNTSLHDSQAQAPGAPVKGPEPNPSAPAVTAAAAAAATPSKPPPLKATTMDHLRMKYLGELEYMLREFRKLERQLLGAKGAAQLEESAGSRERREKLHSFILHLEDTVRQIEGGCAQEEAAEGQGAAPGGQGDETTKEGEDEDTVQKLEEHILANLLPVKTRLKKQLAAQQGATKNPPGMPAPRRGSLQPSSAALGKGTFAAAAEERRKQAEAARLAAQQEEHAAARRVSDPTQFGKPLGGGGSSLTQKLHGATLGSSQRTHGHGVGSSATLPTPSDTKILYAGMVPQSKQHQSSLNAASGVHELVVEDPAYLEKHDAGEPDKSPVRKPCAAQPITVASEPQTTVSPDVTSPKRKSPPSAVPALTSESFEKRAKPHDDTTLSDEERRRLRKMRRKRKLRRIARRREKERQRQLALHQQAQAAQGSAKAATGRKKSASSKPQGNKKGPKPVEYMCALCSEAYSSTCDYNPWWALAQHECPKCRKTQIPRIDISAPANAIDYHPALLAHADENNGGGGGGGGGGPSAATNVNVVHVAQPSPSYKPTAEQEQAFFEGMDSDSETDLSELSDGSLSDDSLDSDDSSMDFQSMSQAEQAEHESFGDDYEGPVLSDDDASRLLVLMSHASTCPCNHKLTKHRDVCKSTKFMMLHVRDCPGTTASFDVCPFPWCRKVKHLLFHLVACADPENCDICSPKHLSDSLKGLTGLNQHRVKKHRQHLIASTKAANTFRPNKSAPPSNARPTVALRQPSRKASDIVKSVAAKAKSTVTPKQETKATKPVIGIQVPNKPAAAAAPAPPIAEQVVIAKQPEIEHAATKTALRPDLTSPAANAETAAGKAEQMEEATMVDSEIATEISPALATLDPPKTSASAPSQLGLAATSTLAVPETTAAVDQTALTESTAANEGEMPVASDHSQDETKESEILVAPKTQPVVPNLADLASVTEVIDYSAAVKNETEEDAAPEASQGAPLATFAVETTTSMGTPTTSSMEHHTIVAAAESTPTTKMDVEDKVGEVPAATTPVTASSAIKENEQIEPSPPAQICGCPPGEAKLCVDHDKTPSEAIAMDTDELVKSEDSSPVDMEDIPSEKSAISGPIQSQASSETLKIACK